MSKYTGVATTAHALSLVAMEESSRFGQRTADIDHLLLALVMSEQPAGYVLRSIGMTLEAARDAVAEQHAAQLVTLGISTEPPSQGRIVFHETGGYEWSDRALEVFTRANTRGTTGDAVAVLRELLAEPSGTIDQILQRLGTTSDEVRGRLDNVQGYPSIASQHTTRPDPGRLSGRAEAFIPAGVEGVWELLADPTRMPEWEPTIEGVDSQGGESGAQIGQSWTAHARTQRADGKPLRVRRGLRVHEVELVARTALTLIEWRFTYPGLAGANAKRIRIELEPAAGGTALRIALTWEPDPSRRRLPLAGLLMRPFVRFGIWMQLSQLAGGISRVFR